MLINLEIVKTCISQLESNLCLFLANLTNVNFDFFWIKINSFLILVESYNKRKKTSIYSIIHKTLFITHFAHNQWIKTTGKAFGKYRKVLLFASISKGWLFFGWVMLTCWTTLIASYSIQNYSCFTHLILQEIYIKPLNTFHCFLHVLLIICIWKPSKQSHISITEWWNQSHP